MTKNQHGFSAIEFLIIVVVTCMIVLVPIFLERCDGGRRAADNALPVTSKLVAIGLNKPGA